MTDTDDPDLLAAEYVLGTADADERALVAARLAAGDAVLARAVRAWEERLSPLAEAAAGIEPPPDLYNAVVRRLFGGTAAPRGVIGAEVVVLALRRRLKLWQGATAAAAALAAALAIYVALGGRQGDAATARLVAVLQRDAGSPVMLVDVDLRARRLTVRPLESAPPAGRAYELWIIDPAAFDAPRSLGLVPAKTGAAASMSAYDPAVIAGATYAVTLEPSGGSPTGRPTSAPVLSGKLVPSRL